MWWHFTQVSPFHAFSLSFRQGCLKNLSFLGSPLCIWMSWPDICGVLLQPLYELLFCQTPIKFLPSLTVCCSLQLGPQAPFSTVVDLLYLLLDMYAWVLHPEMEVKSNLICNKTALSHNHPCPGITSVTKLMREWSSLIPRIHILTIFSCFSADVHDKALLNVLFVLDWFPQTLNGCYQRLV
jgi:hypothetical protein